MVQLLSRPLPAAIHDLGVTIGEVLGSMLLVMAAFAIVDWPLQRGFLNSEDEDEPPGNEGRFKQQEGNMEVKGRIKQRMREMAKKRMLAAVPSADLVVMNPTHYAVALEVRRGDDGAPRVVAKGLDLLAFRIRDIATETARSVLEAPPLARALYANTGVDAEVLHGSVQRRGAGAGLCVPVEGRLDWQGPDARQHARSGCAGGPDPLVIGQAQGAGRSRVRRNEQWETESG